MDGRPYSAIGRLLRFYDDAAVKLPPRSTEENVNFFQLTPVTRGSVFQSRQCLRVRFRTEGRASLRASSWNSGRQLLFWFASVRMLASHIVDCRPQREYAILPL